MTRGRILYVEDNLENRILVKRVLESEGYIVFEAATGNAGLAKAESLSPDLILMDINLPDIDGYDCTAHLRKIEKLNGVPIVAITANVMEGDRQKALDAGLDGYIPKPIDIDGLSHQVAEFLKPPAERSSIALSAELKPTQVAPAVTTMSTTPTAASTPQAAPASMPKPPATIPPPAPKGPPPPPPVRPAAPPPPPTAPPVRPATATSAPASTRPAASDIAKSDGAAPAAVPRSPSTPTESGEVVKPATPESKD